MAKLNKSQCGLCESYIGPPYENYVEFSMMLSDESHARHAVCKQCITILDDAKVALLLERIKDSWFDSMVGWANDAQFEQMKKLKVKSWDLDEKRAISKFKVVREKDHKDELARVLKEKQKEKKDGIK